jgi:hypothetical protein
MRSQRRGYCAVLTLGDDNEPARAPDRTPLHCRGMREHRWMSRAPRNDFFKRPMIDYPWVVPCGMERLWSATRLIGIVSDLFMAGL